VYAGKSNCGQQRAKKHLLDNARSSFLLHGWAVEFLKETNTLIRKTN